MASKKKCDRTARVVIQQPKVKKDMKPQAEHDGLNDCDCQVCRRIRL